MFWKLSFRQPSAIDTLLDKEVHVCECIYLYMVVTGSWAISHACACVTFRCWRLWTMRWFLAYVLTDVYLQA